jgi:hypothetical protein
MTYTWNGKDYLFDVPGKTITSELFAELREKLGMTERQLDKHLTEKGVYTKVKTKEVKDGD